MSFAKEYDKVLHNDLKRIEVLESLGSACNDILVIAPHNVYHWRDNKYKNPEPQTEQLVKLLNIKNDCWGIYKTSSEYEDANIDDICNTKNVIFKLLKEHSEIKTVIFLHQMKKERESDLDIGITYCNSKEKLNMIEDTFNNFQFNVTENKYFAGDFKEENKVHLGKFIYENFNIDCIQLEINSKNLRDEKEDVDYDSCEKVFMALSNSLKNISILTKGKLYK